MNEKIEFIKSIFKHTTFQILIVIGGLAVTLINMFIASKLAPLAANMAVVTQQVSAQSDRITADEQYIPQFIKIQEQVINQKDTLDRIETKVDAIDSYLRGYK